MCNPKNKRRDIRVKKEKVIDLYLNKLMSVEEIGKVYRCSVTPIYNVLRENNILMEVLKNEKENKFKFF